MIATAGKDAMVLVLLMMLAVDCYAEPWEERRMTMISEVRADMLNYVGQSLAPSVEAALASVPRHEFVPMSLADRAYDNRPLPIGAEQTISQPFIVALMTQQLGVGSDARVLEVGTGSGYQAAVLAEICDEVYSIEIIGCLAQDALMRLARLGYHNVRVRHGDGMLGWPEAAPFDAIIVTAAGLEIPSALLDQLRPGGRLVMPVGAAFDVQQLKVIEKAADGLTEKDVLAVRFVPVTRNVR
jgi:protein-L-isoaspartate(D-aspartate) O-methyltransferase